MIDDVFTPLNIIDKSTHIEPIDEIDKLIVTLYVDKKLSRQQISDKLKEQNIDIPNGTIGSILNKYNVEMRSQSVSQSIRLMTPLLDGKILCCICNIYKIENQYDASSLRRVKEGKRGSVPCIKCSRNGARERREKLHNDALKQISLMNNIPIKCIECDETEELDIAHLNSELGFHSEIRDFYHNNEDLYRAIRDGERNTKDLGILCPNHNILDEWKNGYRTYGQSFNIRTDALKVLSKNNNIPLSCQYINCVINDLRILTFEHKNGDGGKEMKNAMQFYKDIILGKRNTSDLTILCCTHQRKSYNNQRKQKQEMEN